jgi:poly(beta-D-mannuronate) lyase
MELGSEGLYRPMNNSPAIDKADPDAFPYVTRDIDGQSRSGMKDIGADEFSTDSAVVYPLLTSDAGPDSK